MSIVALYKDDKGIYGISNNNNKAEINIKEDIESGALIACVASQEICSKITELSADELLDVNNINQAVKDCQGLFWVVLVATNDEIYKLSASGNLEIIENNFAVIGNSDLEENLVNGALCSLDQIPNISSEVKLKRAVHVIQSITGFHYKNVLNKTIEFEEENE